MKVSPSRILVIALAILAPTPAAAQPSVAIEAPAEGGTVTTPFVISGWAVDLQATSSSGIDSVAIYSGTMSAPVLLGYAVSEARPDVAAYFQKPGYANAGYRFTVGSLPAGSQQLGIMVHSTVTNTWHGPYVRNVTVPPSPTVLVDAIPSGIQPIVLQGLAGDPSSTSGTGITAVEVWADPTAGGASIYLGAATTGLYRPDAAVYGQNFMYSGWERVIRGLSPASYVFRVRAQSSITSMWGQGLSASTSVVNDPRIYVQSPANNAQVTTPVTVIGAAADLAASSGTGVSDVHVYVRPVGASSQFLAGQTTATLARPDLQGYVGNNSQFLNIGFQLDDLPIPPGEYDLLTYVQSTVSNTATVLVTRITVVTPAASPVLSPPPGEYFAPVSVSASSATPGAVIRFTVGEDTDPTETSPILPPSTVIAAPGTGRVKAFAPGYLPSATVVAAYTFRAAAPSVSPPPGTYEGPIQFTVGSASPGVVIRYTTNGTDDPTEDSPEFSGTVILPSSATLRFRAFRQGWQSSAVTAATYTITPARPAFTVASGTYTNIQAVGMQSATPSSTIYFTVDGSQPTTSSTPYTAPYSPTTATTIRAITVDAQNAVSPMSEVTISYAVAPVTMQPPPGLYTDGPLQVLLTSETSHAVMRYTFDGTSPGSASPTVANGATVAVTATQTLLVQPYVPNWPSAPNAGGLYTLKVPTPTVLPASGTYARPFAITVSPPPSGGTTTFTTDGTPPTSSSATWTGVSNPPNGAYTYTFGSFAPGWTPSDQVTRAYLIVDSVAATPTFTPPPGDHAVGVAVSITAESGATIYVTTDGTAPTSSSPVYSGPITLTTPTTIRAMARRNGAADSNVAGGVYRLRLQPPSISPPGGTYASIPSVSASHSGQGVTLRYTTDRYDPTETSPVVPASITVSHDTTVKVKAFQSGWAPSDVAANTYYLQSAMPQPSNVVWTSSPASDSAVAIGAPLVVGVSNGNLLTSSVTVLRNGIDVTSQFSRTSSVVSASNAVLAGTNVFELTALDTLGRVAGTLVTVFGTPATFTVQVRDRAGAPIGGAVVTLEDSASVVPSQVDTTSFSGNVTLRVPSGFNGLVTVTHSDHHTFVSPVTGSTITAVMSAKNENFQRGTAEWTLSHPQEVSIRGHFEGILPWICRLNCLDESPFASDTSNMDMLVGTFGIGAPVTAHRTIRVAPGTKGASVRYRFLSKTYSGYYRLTLSNPANGQVIAEHYTTMSALQSAGQTYPPQQNGGIQSVWRNLTASLPASATEMRLTVSLPADGSPGTFDTYVDIDRIDLIGAQLATVVLRDVHQPGNPAAAGELTFISLGPRDPNSGLTEIWGQLRFTGTPDRSLTSVALQVVDNSNTVRTSVPLHPAHNGIIGVPLSEEGVSTGVSQRLFEFTDAQMQAFSRTSEESFVLRVAATDSTGAAVVAAAANSRRVTKLADIQSSIPRRSHREPLQCKRDDGSELPWPCRGDGWGRPKVQSVLELTTATLAAVPSHSVTMSTNDISNMNGGYFPTHGAHRLGTNLDLWIDGYDRKDDVLAVKLAQVVTTMIAAANQVTGITFTRILVSYPESGPFATQLAGLQINGVAASNYIRRDSGPVHLNHFHAEFLVPAP